MVSLNPGDPLTFFVLVVLAGIVIAGFAFFAREIISEAILLAERKKEWRKRKEQADRFKENRR